MTNVSLKAAFERFWLHVLGKIDGKADITEVDAKLDTKADKVHQHTKSEITDFPTIPSKTSDLVNDSGFVTTDNNTTYTIAKENEVFTLYDNEGNEAGSFVSQTIEIITWGADD